jgi:hypothetical protein
MLTILSWAFVLENRIRKMGSNTNLFIFYLVIVILTVQKCHKLIDEIQYFYSKMYFSWFLQSRFSFSLIKLKTSFTYLFLLFKCAKKPLSNFSMRSVSFSLIFSVESPIQYIQNQIFSAPMQAPLSFLHCLVLKYGYRLNNDFSYYYRRNLVF